MWKLILSVMLFSFQVKAEVFSYNDLTNLEEGNVSSVLIRSQTVTVNGHQEYEWKECEKVGFVCYSSYPLVVVWPKKFDRNEWDYSGITFKAVKVNDLSLLGERFDDLYAVKSSSRNLGSIFFISQRCGMIAIQDVGRKSFLLVDRRCGLGRA
ncbi:hypothetical protein BTJ40_04695 [Microbulbifer sp. A4B17]|uniref:hypothetical protein n=1 Tax=Microbulbifer sp. A4B17 TaxID=359370 RepID=UPI000D52B42A|nr:hypothetical protein [Microbulbifer sp. A4B17]AWF80172.1 hypothetical protein BTJ40_04695 [Microbulbifer sp. A4B17]